MKTIKHIGLAVLGLGTLVLAAFAPRWVRNSRRGLSPGKRKKRSGAKSARNTPGQGNNSGSRKHHGNRRSHSKR